jgi:hypothetical protein
MNQKESNVRNKHQHPSLLDAITGTGRRPSTLDVIELCWDTERLIARSRRTFEPDPRRDDRRAVLDQVRWLLEAAAIEEDPTKREDQERLSEELLRLHDQLLAEETRARIDWSDLAGRTVQVFCAPLVYAVEVAVRSLLLSLLYALLVAGFLLALSPLFA